LKAFSHEVIFLFLYCPFNAKLLNKEKLRMKRFSPPHQTPDLQDLTIIALTDFLTFQMRFDGSQRKITL